MTSMAIKSGTKQFHASAWEYNRNDALDAYSYLSKQTSPVQKKPELRYNAYGFNVGGPAEFKSSNPKTFFFYNMEWSRLVSRRQHPQPGADRGTNTPGNMTPAMAPEFMCPTPPTRTRSRSSRTTA